jgi:2-methylcitrate dehydratase PrpD
MDYLDTLSSFAAGLRFAALPQAVRTHTGWILADTLAAIAAGSAEPELRALAQRQGTRAAPGAGATLIGLGTQAHPEAAALVNGTGGTFLEMDEGNRFSRGHPAIHVLPAALALCEREGADADTFLSALVVGYEVGSRLGAASQLRSAMHPHGTWGTVGAAAACARVMGLDAAGMRETVNIASSLTTATSKRTMLEGGLVRNVYAGMSNRNGLLAVELAGCGFTGERDGPGSLFGQIISERFDTTQVLRDLGQDWHLLHNYFKLHSCCRYNHGTLDALDAIEAAQGAQGGLPAPEDIARIEVRSYHLAAELDDKAPRNTLAAKFSVPFAVATRLVNGSSAMASFTWDAVRDPRILALAQKVELAEDPAMTQRLPMERPARVVITGTDGRQWVGEAGVNRGDDASPYTADELTTKFMDLTGRVWPAEHAQHLLQATHALCAGEGTFSDWCALLRRPPRA